jgi:hypothetical protein
VQQSKGLALAILVVAERSCILAILSRVSVEIVSHMRYSKFEAKICTERKMEMGWESFAAKAPVKKSHPMERSKLVLPRHAGVEKKMATIERHHGQHEVTGRYLEFGRTTFGFKQRCLSRQVR